MKTITAKYIAPLVLAVGIMGGFVGFELSQAFTLSSSEKSVQGDDLSHRQLEKSPSNSGTPHGNQGDKKRPVDTDPGPRPPTPIL